MITKLNIIFDPDSKQLRMEGPLDDTMFVLGLLEMAKLTIIERRSKTSNVIDIGKDRNAK